MKRALQRLAGPKKLVRRVLSKTSNSSQGSNECRSEQNLEVTMSKENAESLIASEIGALREQIDNLKAALEVLQNDLEQKEMVIAKLARDKEKLSLDLLKQKRSNTSIAQQLDDERHFYFKEKELYCQEMNEIKKVKRNMSSSTISLADEKSIAEYKTIIAKLKESLNQTLEANYNLSIKFLRMKNTKTCLKTEFKKLKLDHEKIVIDLKGKIEKLSVDVDELVKDKLCLNISPSSKKYLQLVKQNSCLLYENLCLQLEVDRLSLKFEKQKLNESRAEKNTMLQYIKHETPEPTPKQESETKPEKKKHTKEQKRVRINLDAPEKLEKPQITKNKRPVSKNAKIVKIFERKERPGVPNIQILNEEEVEASLENILSNHLLHVPEKDSNIQKLSKVMEMINANENSEKLTLLQVSDVQSQVSSDYNDCNSVYNADATVRVQSAPEIVQRTKFDECKK